MDEQVRKVCFRQIVALAAAGARGLEPQLPEKQNIDWPWVAQLAMKQGVLTIVGCAVMRNSNTAIPGELGEQIIDHTRMVAAKNQIRQQRIMWLINKYPPAMPGDIYCFGRFDDGLIDGVSDSPLDMQTLCPEINIFPLKSQHFLPPQSGVECQSDVYCF